MTGSCVPGDQWPVGCLSTLRLLLMTGNRDAIAEWMGSHIDGTDDSWDSFAVALASYATERAAEGRDHLRGSGREVVVAPMPLPSDAPQSLRDAVLVMSTVLNEDAPGTIGVLRGVRSRGGHAFEELCGALGAVATRALNDGRRL